MCKIIYFIEEEKIKLNIFLNIYMEHIKIHLSGLETVNNRN